MRYVVYQQAVRFLPLVLIVLLAAGCSQRDHRLHADREAYCTIAERNGDPRWQVHDYRIDLDSRSRYFDPYNPDCSPMPVDDPASHRYMHCVDGKKGWKHWHDNGTRRSLANPSWRSRLGEYAELDEQGAVKLSVDSALRLAYVHSPLHQRALETLYLSSLDVTGQRFRLDTQYFAGNDVIYNHSGDTSPASIAFSPALGRYVITDPGTIPESNRLTGRTDLAANKRFATAAEVMVGFANSIMFEFTGSDVRLASSLANFAFTQPLLRGAGRDVALEQLTLSERRLLANLRAYSQFRQGLFTQIVIGELGVEGPQRGGADTDLQSFSGFGGLNGYLGLLQQAQQIRNTEDNLRLQLRTRDRLEALYDNDLIDIVQLDQFRQNIEATRANLLDQTNGLELAVDNYKTQILGLPPNLPVNVDEQLVEVFQLVPVEAYPLLQSLLEIQMRIGDIGDLTDLAPRIDSLEKSLVGFGQQEIADVESTLIKLQSVFEAVGRRLKYLPIDLLDANKGELSQVEGLRDGEASLPQIVDQLKRDVDEYPDRFEAASDRLDAIIDRLTEENLQRTIEDNTDWISELLTLSRRIVLVQSAVREIESEPSEVLADIEPFVEPVSRLFAQAHEDVKRMDEIVPQRERIMREDEKLLFKRDRERLHQRLDELENGEDGFIVAEERIKQIIEESSDGDRKKTIRDLTAWIQTYLKIVERLSLIPAQARLEVIMVEEIDLDADAAFQIALENRLDFMNGRAALVDQWRAITVAADALQSNLTVTGSGDIRAADNNPVDFRASTSRLRLGLEFDAPLARLLERNGYRETLITYQRSRRSLIQSHDSLQRGLRALLRTLKQRRLQLEIQRRAVSIALRRVDQTQLSLLTPSPQMQPGSRPNINPTTAINLLSAQSSLQNSQNSLLTAWLSYYAARLRLFRELGAMELDPSGRWIENSVQFGALAGESLDGTEPLPPPVPVEVIDVEFFDQAGQNSNREPREIRNEQPLVVITPNGTQEVRKDTKTEGAVRVANRVGF